MVEKSNHYEYISYEDFEEIQSLETNYKLEYDNGFICYMTPVYPNHDRVKNKIAFNLMNLIGKQGKCEVFTSDVAVLFEDNGDKYEYEPDIMVCCEPGKFKGAKYMGVPSLIVEILSYSTEYRDAGIKLENYKKFGVKEYWIVDISERKIISYSDNVNGEYMFVEAYTDGMLIPFMELYDMEVSDIFSVLK